MIQLHRHVAFPRNVYIHAVLLDEGRLEDAHYGVFASPKQPLGEAQHSLIKLLLAELPKPPARILTIGYGVGSTARALRKAGYRLTVLTTDVNEVRIAAKAPIDGVQVVESPLELFAPRKPPFDAVLARECALAMDIVAVMRGAHTHLAKGGRLVLAEELPAEIAREAGKAAQHLGYAVGKSRALGEAVKPTIEHLRAAISRQRARLKIELRLTEGGVDDVLGALTARKAAYESGAYEYLLLTLLKT